MTHRALLRKSAAAVFPFVIPKVAEVLLGHTGAASPFERRCRTRHQWAVSRGEREYRRRIRCLQSLLWASWLP